MAAPDEGIGSASTDEPGATAPPAKRGNRAAMAAVLAVIAVAGVVIYQNIPLRPWFPAVANQSSGPQAQALPPGPDTPDGPDPADATSLLRISRTDDGRTVVALDRVAAIRDLPQFMGTDQDLLFRELVRQSVLLAAHDERGAATRDELLDDVKPADGEVAVAEVGSLFRLGFRSRMLVRPVSDGVADVKAEPLLSADLAPRDSKGVGLELVGVMEKLSRTEIPAALDRLGLQGKPNAQRPDAPLPEGVEEKLNTLGMVDHVLALRDLHAAIRADGESPARLEALARGYARLGALTVHHWSAAHRAFEARALLYAERLKVKESGSPRSLRVRALVEALVGVHSAAIKDLEAAAGADGGAPAPAWVDAVDAYVHYQPAKLTEAKPPYDRLAAYLRMTALEFSSRGSRQLVHAAKDVLRLDPDCARAYDVICGNGGLGDLHEATVLGPRSFHEFFRGKLAKAGDLPPEVREALKADAEDQALDDALAAAKGGEPSWGTLAHLALETRFVQVQRRVNFMRNKWNVPVDDFWTDARPSIERHPYRPFLGLQTGLPEEAADFGKFVLSYDRSDLEPTEGEFLLIVQHAPGSIGSAARDDWNLTVAHTTASARDFSMTLLSTRDEVKPFHAERMMEYCPFDPLAASVLVRTHWTSIQTKLADWRERFGDSAGFLSAYVGKLLEAGRHEEAQPLLTRYIIMSPDRWGYEKLAECQEKAGDEAGWLETLESYLEDTEDAGLDHAGIQVKLARRFLEKNEPEKARPFSDAAAQTWAGWAMLCAADVDEATGDLDAAGEWRRRTAERYPKDWAQWYLFAARTGRGGLDEARRVALAMAERPGALKPIQAAFIDWNEGRPEEAAGLLESDDGSTPPLALAIYAALLHDQGDDAEKRAEAVKRLPELKDQGPVTARIAGMLFDSLADGAPPPDLAAIDALIAPMKPFPHAFCDFLVGRFLLNRGRAEDARKYLESCVATAELDLWSRAAAASWLRAAFPDAGDGKTPAPDSSTAPTDPAGV